ncbi:MAG TPA: TonB family protein [Holophagaceae bacterium]|nr:TonB family protein [Holophagaceae bacterium]
MPTLDAMKAFPLFLVGCLAMGQETARPPVAVVLETQARGNQVVPVDQAQLHADLSALLKENGLAEEASQTPGNSHLTLYPETFQLPEGIAAFSVQGILESPGRREALKGSVVAALRGKAGLSMELRQAAVDVAAALLQGRAPGGSLVKGLALADTPAASQATEIPFERLKVRTHPMDPPYPVLARNRGIQGLVVVRLTVDASGKPERADLVSGPQELGLAALYHAMLWSFDPIQGPAGPSRARTTLKVPFSLSRGFMNPAIPIYDLPRKIDSGLERHERDQLPR